MNLIQIIKNSQPILNNSNIDINTKFEKIRIIHNATSEANKVILNESNYNSEIQKNEKNIKSRRNDITDAENKIREYLEYLNDTFINSKGTDHRHSKLYQELKKGPNFKNKAQSFLIETLTAYKTYARLVNNTSFLINNLYPGQRALKTINGSLFHASIFKDLVSRLKIIKDYFELIRKEYIEKRFNYFCSITNYVKSTGGKKNNKYKSTKR